MKNDLPLFANERPKPTTEKILMLTVKLDCGHEVQIPLEGREIVLVRCWKCAE